MARLIAGMRRRSGTIGVRGGVAAFAALALAMPAIPQSAISTQDKSVGAQAHPQLLAEYGGAMRGAQADYVARVARRVAVQSGLSNAASDFTVTLLDSPVENAFAIPGGYVYVTRQLLALMNGEDELAAVLGHEIGHVAARHAAKRSSRSTIGSILAAGVGVLTGSDLLGQAAGYGAQLYTLSFSRTQEYQADGLGVRYIAAAGYDPNGMAAMLASLDAETNLQATIAGRGRGGPSWASTHPNGPDRVARATRLAGEVGGGSAAAPAGQDVAFLRMLDGLPYDGEAATSTTAAIPAPRQVRIVTVGAGDTIDGLAARMAYPDRRRERFLVLNGLEDGEALRPGRLAKLIVAR